MGERGGNYDGKACFWITAIDLSADYNHTKSRVVDDRRPEGDHDGESFNDERAGYDRCANPIGFTKKNISYRAKTLSI